ncbi:MAG: cysteine synthase A [Planctomycetes bacterium]|nr:cysteine synthase A [Planctomycetota bacterium]
MPSHKINPSVLDLIGATPIVRLNRLNSPSSADVLVKLEYMNPMASIKDRIALAMIDAAEKSGALKPGGTIVEPTSGNTGIGLAMVAAVRGYKLILTMPSTMSLERRRILSALGAEIALSAGEEGMAGAIALASRIAGETAAFLPQQFSNPANPDIHYRTTAREIWHDTDGQVDAFVAGVGTGGTLAGVARFLREKRSSAKIIAVEPADSPVLSGGEPGPHGLQGIGAGFVPDVLDMSLVDDVMPVTQADAVHTARLLAREEAVFCGFSSGANVWAALKVASSLKPGRNVVTVACDWGERYLSTDLFPSPEH